MPSLYRKAYAYAYAHSPHAETLGHAKTGCYYIERETRREDGAYVPAGIWPSTEGEASPEITEHLRTLYAEIDAPVSPYCLSKREAMEERWVTP